MQVTAMQGSDSASTQKTASTGLSADSNMFLKLLIAQIKNQDPTSPTDPTQFMSQLAAYSSVEQATKTNAKLDSLLLSSNLTQADGLIGATLTSADGQVSGIVASVSLQSGGVIATLGDGSLLTVGDGVSVSRP